MARLQPRPGPGQKRAIASKLAEVPSSQITCRLRHKWPSDELEDGKEFPKGLSAVRVKGGCFQIRDVCARCGKIRLITTLPKGVFDTSAVWSYVDPPDWVRIDPALEIGKREIRAENTRRNAARLFGDGS